MVNQDPIKTLGEPLETVDKRLNDLENMCSTPRALMRRDLCQQSLARDFYDWEVGMYKHSHVEQIFRDWKQGQASKKGYTSEYARTKSADKQVCERIRKAISHGTKLLWLNKFAPELPRLSIFLMLSSIKNHISYKGLAELVTDIRSTTATDNNSANSDCSRRMSFIMFVRTECSWTTRASDLYGEQITANISTRKRKHLDTEAAPPPSSVATDCLRPSSSIPIGAPGFDPQIASSYYSSGIPVDETVLDQFPLLPQYPYYLSSQHSDGVVVSEMALYQHFLPSQYASYE